MSKEDDIPGEALARVFKYYLQFQKQGVVTRPIPAEKIRARGLYEKGKPHWDKVAAVFSKHGLDPAKYVKFLVEQLRFTDRTDPASVSDPASLRKFQAYVQYEKKRDGAYEQYNKTVRWLAAKCLENRKRGSECLSGVLKSGNLAQLYVCGIMSKYFLAAIPGFGQAVDKLDHFARNELWDFKGKYDIYRAIVCDAFIKKEGRKPDPVQDVDFAAAALAKEARLGKIASSRV
jgi:hypothetical protein